MLDTSHLAHLVTDDAALRALPTEVRNALLDDWEAAEADAAAEYDADAAHERWLENGGAYSEAIAWENYLEDQREREMINAGW